MQVVHSYKELREWASTGRIAWPEIYVWLEINGYYCVQKSALILVPPSSPRKFFYINNSEIRNFIGQYSCWIKQSCTEN